VEIKGKNIIVTGGAGGIGRATARLFLRKGAAALGVIDRDKECLDAFMEELPIAARERVIPYLADVGHFDNVERVVNEFFERFGRIDGLVNNAAVLKDGTLVSVFGELKKYSLEDWNDAISSNLCGTFYCTREVAEKMILKRTRGVIVNVSSVSAAGNAGQTSYAASKGAIDALTVSWSQELVLFGIRVAGLAPGLTDTQMPRRSMKEKTLSQWIARTPMRRMGTPEEMAEAILFIFNNNFFCGRTLELDGGFRL